MPEYLAVLGVGVASGLMPLVNVEAYLLGLTLLAPAEAPWPLALPAAIGQVSGKLVYYYAARGSLRLQGRARESPVLAWRPSCPSALRSAPLAAVGARCRPAVTACRRLVARLRPLVVRCRPVAAAVAGYGTRSARLTARWRARAEARPRWCLGMVGISAFAGLPPFGVMSAVAGGIRLRVASYLLVGLPGRCARFSLLLLAPELIDQLSAIGGSALS